MVESYFTKNPGTQPDDSIDEKNKDLDKSKEAKPYLKRTIDKVKFNSVKWKGQSRVNCGLHKDKSDISIK